MTVLSEAKALLRAAKTLQHYSEKLQYAAAEIQSHQKHFIAAGTDSEKQSHLDAFCWRPLRYCSCQAGLSFSDAFCLSYESK